MKRFKLVVFIMAIFSCNNQNNYKKSSNLSVKDSLLEMYFNSVDKMPWIDTTEIQYKMLVSSYKNDVGTLRALIREDQFFFNNSLANLGISCPKPKRIDLYDFDTVYRFMYHAARCDQVIIITVGCRKDSIIMFSHNYKIQYNTDSCISFEKRDKILSLKEWNVVKQGIFKADLWGLKRENGRWGADGSSMNVIGYERPYNEDKIHYVHIYRWAAEKTALGEVFGNIIQISNVQVPCFNRN